MRGSSHVFCKKQMFMICSIGPSTMTCLSLVLVSVSTIGQNNYSLHVQFSQNPIFNYFKCTLTFIKILSRFLSGSVHLSWGDPWESQASDFYQVWEFTRKADSKKQELPVQWKLICIFKTPVKFGMFFHWSPSNSF